MHLCFIDEFSTPPKPTKANPRPYFTLAGVFVPASQWRAVASEIQTLKDRSNFRIRGELKWRYFGRNNNDKKNNVSHLTADEHKAFRQDFYGLLGKSKNIKPVVIVTKISCVYDLGYYKDEHNIYAYGYKQIIEQLQ